MTLPRLQSLNSHRALFSFAIGALLVGALFLGLLLILVFSFVRQSTC